MLLVCQPGEMIVTYDHAVFPKNKDRQGKDLFKAEGREIPKSPEASEQHVVYKSQRIPSGVQESEKTW